MYERLRLVGVLQPLLLLGGKELQFDFFWRASVGRCSGEESRHEVDGLFA